MIQRRNFRQPATNAVASVGLKTVIGTLFAGPFYYWSRGALIEGTIMSVFGLMSIFVDDETLSISADTFDNIGWAVWGAFVLLSPLVLAWSYRRRGWIDITPGAE
ncbi:MAG TPA: hypothetical protein VN802_01855 [Stellaceae bacterium]|nr:hypothetical protein [Stellaceae bacterium]